MADIDQLNASVDGVIGARVAEDRAGAPVHIGDIAVLRHPEDAHQAVLEQPPVAHFALRAGLLQRDHLEAVFEHRQARAQPREPVFDPELERTVIVEIRLQPQELAGAAQGVERTEAVRPRKRLGQAPAAHRLDVAVGHARPGRVQMAKPEVVVVIDRFADGHALGKLVGDGLSGTKERLRVTVSMASVGDVCRWMR